MAHPTPRSRNARSRNFRCRTSRSWTSRSWSAAPIALLAATAVVLAACSSSDGSTDTSAGSSPVLATTSIWADVTRHVACDEVEVASLIPRGADAHEFEPSVQDADALRSAQLVVANGLGLEEGLHDALDTASSDGVTVLEVGPDLQPLAADGHAADDEHAEEDEQSGQDQHADEDEHADEEHDHGDEDPHVWMDPERVADAVPLIAAALAEVDDLGVPADRLETCAEEYAASLRELSAEMERTLAVVAEPQRRLVTNHEALGYFADRFGFTVVGAAVPSTSSLGESNPRELDELAATMREEGVRAVFAETTSPTDLADALADQVGGDVQVVELYTESLGEEGGGASTYVEMMTTDATRVAEALGTGTPGAGQ